MKKTLVLALSLFAQTSFAGGHFYLCDIFNGEASSACGSWYQGKAVVWKDESPPPPQKSTPPATTPAKKKK